MRFFGWIVCFVPRWLVLEAGSCFHVGVLRFEVDMWLRSLFFQVDWDSCDVQRFFDGC